MSRRTLRSAAVIPTASEAHDPNALNGNESSCVDPNFKDKLLTKPAIPSQTEAALTNSPPQHSTNDRDNQSTQLSSADPTQLYTVKNVHTSTKRVKNYNSIAATFRRNKRFSRSSDGTYSDQANCVLCMASKPTCVFFPCQHMCVCNKCISTNDMSPDFPMLLDRWCVLLAVHELITCLVTFSVDSVCPVCKADIFLILPHTGTEEMEYWDWVLATKPALPSEFKFDFKIAGIKLSEHSVAESKASTASSTTRHESRGVTQSSQQFTPSMRRSSNPTPVTRRMSAYKLGAAKKQESCLIL